jgi:hypothetical protein
MRRVLISLVAFASIGTLLASGGCVSVPWQYHSDRAVKRGDFPREKTGLISLVVGFEEIPDDLNWEVELTLVSEESGGELVLTAPGKAIVTGRISDKVPIFFSLPKGKYTHKELVLRFPKSEESLYTLSTERVSLPLNEPLPKLRVAEKRVTYLGQVEIEKTLFVPGQKSPETRISAVWNPRAPLAGNIWLPYRKNFEFETVEQLRAVEVGAKVEVPLFFFDQTTESAIATLNSGFSDIYALIVVVADRPGYAFFDDGNRRVVRLASKVIDGRHLFALPASNGERFSLRGLCFSEGDPASCPYENTPIETLFNQREFQPGEIRYRGTFRYDATAGRVFPQVVLGEPLQETLKKTFPFATVRSFVLGEAPFVKENYKYVFFTAAGQKDRWDAVSLPFMDAFSKRVKACEAELRRVDPFVTSTFELNFAVGDSKKLETVVALGKGGIVGPALEVLKPCLDAELKSWNDFEKGEVAAGFGLRFE